MRIRDWSSDVCSFRSRIAEPPRAPLGEIGSEVVRRQCLQHVRIDRAAAMLRQKAAKPLRRRDIGASRMLRPALFVRSEEHTSELQSLMRISYAVFCLKKKNTYKDLTNHTQYHTQSPL